MPDVVLVTGVSRYVGGRLARRLTAQGDLRRVIGVDVVAPAHDLGGAEFVRADIRSPGIGRIIERAQVDTVVHLNVVSTPARSGGRASQKEINVIGTMQLLAACQQSPAVRRLVVKSSGAVYGASAHDPAMFTEETPARVAPTAGFAKDAVEVEQYVRGFSRRRPDVEVAMLRMANILGPGIRTALTDYFRLPALPAALGHDPRMMFLHEDDAVDALLAATSGGWAGTVNVAGDGIITLTQAAMLLRRPLVALPLLESGAVGGMLRRGGLSELSPDVVAFLTYGRGLDTRKMREEIGFQPRHDTRGTFRELAAAVPGAIPGLDRVARAALEGLGLGRADGRTDGAAVPGAGGDRP